VKLTVRKWIDLLESYSGREATLKDGSTVALAAHDDYNEDFEYPLLSVYATVDGNTVGSLLFDPEGHWVRGVDVRQNYRRLGVATAMYDYLEHIVGTVKASPHLEPDGEAFWAARRSRKK
jgi:GNAT superfamily N-acetyltransferase